MNKNDLISRCRSILCNLTHDENAGMNAADELAELLIETSNGNPKTRGQKIADESVQGGYLVIPGRNGFAAIRIVAGDSVEHSATILAAQEAIARLIDYEISAVTA